MEITPNLYRPGLVNICCRHMDFLTQQCKSRLFKVNTHSRILRLYYQICSALQCLFFSTFGPGHLTHVEWECVGTINSYKEGALEIHGFLGFFFKKSWKTDISRKSLGILHKPSVSCMIYGCSSLLVCISKGSLLCLKLNCTFDFVDHSLDWAQRS